MSVRSLGRIPADNGAVARSWLVKKMIPAIVGSEILAFG
jgi:hypothetical protein